MKKIYSLALIMCLMSIGVVSATSFEPTKDSKVGSAQPSTNFGLGRYAMVNDKYIAKDRTYMEFDLSNVGNVNSAILQDYVYYTGNQAVNQKVQAWFCPSKTFTETTINFNNQPSQWDVNGNPVTYTNHPLYWWKKVVNPGNGCTLADEYLITNNVVAGSPETKHTFDLTSEVNSDSDKKFVVVLKYKLENVANNYRYVQYLAREYPEATFRPHLVVN